MVISFLKLKNGFYRATTPTILEPLPSTPLLTSGGNGSTQTNATGTTYTALTSQVCKQVTIINNTGTAIGVRQDGAGAEVAVFDGSYYTFYGITNANQLAVRRVDVSNTQVTTGYRWEA